MDRQTRVHPELEAAELRFPTRPSRVRGSEAVGQIRGSSPIAVVSIGADSASATTVAVANTRSVRLADERTARAQSAHRCDHRRCEPGAAAPALVGAPSSLWSRACLRGRRQGASAAGASPSARATANRLSKAVAPAASATNNTATHRPLITTFRYPRFVTLAKGYG